MASITVRSLGISNGQYDPQRGQGLQNFLNDIDAVGQIINSRLLLFTNEWWESLGTGLPLFTNILGVPSTSQAVALLLRQNILGAPFVLDIQQLVVNYSPAGRAYSYSALVQTAFGALAIQSQPLPGLIAS